MHLTKMRIGGEAPFTRAVSFNLDERVNLFVGPNASGKSVVLLMLADYFIGQGKAAKRPIARGWRTLGFTGLLSDGGDSGESVAEYASRLGMTNFLAASADWVGDRENPIMHPVHPPVVYIGPVREGLPGISGVAHTHGYGDTIAEVLAGPFSGSRTMYAYNLLAVEFWRDDVDETVPRARVVVMDGVELADACSKAVCAEIIKDVRSHNYIPGQDIRDFLDYPLARVDNIRVLRMMAVNTTDIRNFNHLDIDEEPSYSAYYEDADAIPIYLGHLSAGTEGTLLWIRWLALKMMHHYEFADDWAKQPAILLIDEIENHLHPTWQRRVIPALLEYFPGLQIFATAHSPFVIAGLRTGQVHLLNRDASGVVTASSNDRDIIGWTADQILRTFMGVDEPTDQLTVDRNNRLRELHGKASLTAEEETELNDLRRQVGENFPLNPVDPQLDAQRERYADMMERFLRSRMSDAAPDDGQA